MLLLGEQAEALAPRLALSGYRPLRADPLNPDPGPAGRAEDPAALILAPGLEERLPELRRRWGSRPMLLGIERDDVAGRARCLRSGATDIWFPDVGASDLLGRLRLHLSRPTRLKTSPEAPTQKVGQAAGQRSGGLRLDPGRRRAWRGERQIQLSTRETALLQLLHAHQGQVVSREMILASVWSGERPAASNVIEVYVRYLRRKLEQGGERRLLHTVRGQGYRLGDPPTPSP
ncbi:MAG: response regulator transcription factor [Synechococcaceae cyanobacterium]|nr:response regulator transcription factor [Synechococcaceae cyanobacterium]